MGVETSSSTTGIAILRVLALPTLGALLSGVFSQLGRLLASERLKFKSWGVDASTSSTVFIDEDEDGVCNPKTAGGEGKRREEQGGGGGAREEGCSTVLCGVRE